jgi:myo-inositol-1-phosphate synthase
MPASVSSPRVGVRLIGARGSVATTDEGEVHIDDVPALGDGKTAWDPIAFDGCLGIRTVLQTIWQGCASSLGERHAAVVGFARRAATPRTGAAPGDTTEGGGAGTDGRTEARPGDRPGEGAVRTERPGEER